VEKSRILWSCSTGSGYGIEVYFIRSNYSIKPVYENVQYEESVEYEDVAVAVEYEEGYLGGRKKRQHRCVSED